MDHQKTEAIVLRVVEFSETSCIVTMFTRKLGKISTIAKGARRKKNPFEGALDLIAVCRIVFLHKSSQSLDILTEAKLDRRFRCASTDLDRFYAGLYVIELLNLLTDEDDPHELLFDESIQAIERIDGDWPLRDAVIEFEIRMLDLLGHLPMLTQCVGCGRKRQTMNRVHFGLNEGGVICPQCRAGKQNIISLSSEGLELLLNLTKAAPSELCRSPEDSNQTSNHIAYREVRSLVSKYILHLIGYPPRLHKYLGSL